jgi:hypothetical protein
MHLCNPNNSFTNFLNQMKNILLVSAAAWLLTIALALVSSPSKSAANEPLRCLVQKGGTVQSKQATKSTSCQAYVGSDTRQDELEPANALKR